jgi:hypothetical protein
MAIIVEVLSPTVEAVTVPGNSTIIEVVSSTQTPIVTDSTRAVIDVVGPRSITGIVTQQTEPTSPVEGMVWLSW